MILGPPSSAGDVPKTLSEELRTYIEIRKDGKMSVQIIMNFVSSKREDIPCPILDILITLIFS